MKKQILAVLLLLWGAPISTSIVHGAVRLTVPDEFPGIPAYARTDVPLIAHTEEWAAIVFYRDPACVPEAFNLLELLDAPAAWGCPLTVAGFEIWENGPLSSDLGPIFSELQGLGAVPVWFVSWPALQAEIADGVLKIGDLKRMDSLRGLASFFQETLQPLGVAQQPNYHVLAQGHLEDGRSFQYQAVVTHPPSIGDRAPMTRISFK